MHLKPASVEELAKLIADAHARVEKVSSFDLSALNRLLEHKAEDMTATVEAGMTLAEFQQRLATHRQWLPIDPPNADQLTVGALLATNASGPRRFGYGTVRDYVIRVKAVLADGRLIHSGSKVVKNVAGYDLMKLFIGSRGSLGIIVEVTFKLRPLPETEAFAMARCDSLEKADKLIEAVLNSDLMPMVLDLHNLPPGTGPFTLVLGFAGTRQEVEWQMAGAAELGFGERTSLDYDQSIGAANLTRKTSGLPSKTISVIRRLNGAPCVVRVGNGIIYHGGTSPGTKPDLPESSEPHEQAGTDSGAPELAQRLKDEFDPKHILPELPL